VTSSPPKRPAPEFRPPLKRQRDRRSWLSEHRSAVIVSALGILLVAAAGFAALLLLGGDDGAAPAISDSGTRGGPNPRLEPPASRYIPALSEAPPGYQVIPPETYGMNGFQFATQSGLFRQIATGQDKANEWRYVDGYRASYEPIGKGAGVLQGGYWLTVDSYLFDQASGAEGAFDYLKAFYDSVDGSKAVDAPGLANQSGAWALEEGTILQSEMPAVYHRFVFRRGNLLTIVQTLGGTPYMTIDQARQIAVIADERALGQREQTTPTPAATQQLPATESATP
jgi:hypothetical protein